jgi:glutamate-ammonia-ligase adenylyltransferase
VSRPAAAEPRRAGDAAAALAKAGFQRPTESSRHLESLLLERDAWRRVARACAKSADPDLAAASMTRWLKMSGHVPAAGALDRLAAVLGVSSSMGDFLARHPAMASVVTEGRALDAPRSLEAFRRGAMHAVTRNARPLPALRLYRRRETLRIACRDLALGASLDEIATEIAFLAQATVRAALSVILEDRPPPTRARFAVIGMGKLGGVELNYASDIDLLYVYDGDDGDETREWAFSIATVLSDVLSDRTADGQLYRVDTTLRPEGRQGALVRSLAAYEAYYGRWARPWEWQAMLKARPIAGDADLGRRFDELAQRIAYPEVLSADAVREIRELKARAERVLRTKGRAENEIKRGPGGIRDIEFAVQLLQLVHGRRDERLRTPTTLEGLEQLARRGYIGDDDAAELATAYRFLRRVEHRLQLAQERQTHEVPEDEVPRRKLARAMGFADDEEHSSLEAFDLAWRQIQRVVRRIHEKLFYRPLLERFAQAPALNPDAAQERLGALGFRQPGRALKMIGDLTAGLSRRAQLMRNLLPVMLDWMSRAPDPDLAVAGFRDLALRIGGNPTLLATLRDQPPVVRLLCLLLGTSRQLGEHLQHVPELISELADPSTLAEKPRDAWLAEAAAVVGWRQEPADRDAALRRYRRRGGLQIAARELSGEAEIASTTRQLTWLAEGALNAAVDGLEEELRKPAGARFAVIAMGRFGGGELGYGSDLDVMFVYDAPDDAKGALHWATELAEGVIGRLAAPTEDGTVFKVDASLRPEGNAGLLVRSIDAYDAYYRRSVEPWEIMALTKARPVAGDAGLGARFVDLIRPVLWRERLDDRFVREVRALKARVEKERLGPREDQRTQLKVGHGGLIDVEFTVQLLQLQHGYREHAVRTTNTLAAIDALRSVGVLDRQRALHLADAWSLATRARNALFLVKGRPVDQLPRDAEELEVLARAIGYPAPGARHAYLEQHRKTSRRARAICEERFYGREPDARVGRARRGLEGDAGEVARDQLR